MRPTIFLMKGWARAPQNENKVPFKVQMPFELKNQVSGKGSALKERGCLYEISLVLACLQQNNFENKLCTKEVTSFHQCYKTYLSNNYKSKELSRKGILTPYVKTLKPHQLNQLLRKYPQV